MCCQVEDSQIIDLFWERNEDAIRETAKAYGGRLYMLANHILRNRQDAEESVSDTYIQAWNVIPPQRPNYLFAFLASICRHMAFRKLDWLLSAKRNAEVVSLSEEMALCIPDEARAREVSGRELGQFLDRFLESLPQESRLLFLRRYWYGDTIAEIAARYGMGESKVKMRLSRTRDQLRRYLKKEEIAV